MEKPSSYCKTVSTIPKTSFGQINFGAIVEGVGLNVWGVGSVFRNVTSRMEKDENLQGMIRFTCCVYAGQLKTTWDVKNWDQESSKTSRTKQLVDVSRI
jgi:hypothetical protein